MFNVYLLLLSLLPAVATLRIGTVNLGWSDIPLDSKPYLLLYTMEIWQYKSLKFDLRKE